MLARMLDSPKALTIVTNSLMAAAQLMESPHRLILTGGEPAPSAGRWSGRCLAHP